ncbi:UDP-glycosyltransferase 1 [Lathyrus oleraceus]|uniref:Glycosyltransferase n=1 Tax=Pisum sativum TaxID=3888 RepID=A0A9D5GWD8_PEA|nr:UDP-glycosyltransferase 1-like [Pisum sativum]KAI5443836.1 hypothetical protein KIW84_012474 [Pisum sativum]
MKDTIVLYPALESGHLMSMVELGKFILTQNPSFSITILILTPPNNKHTPLSPQEQYIASISATFPSIHFHYIPPITFTTTLPTHLQSIDLSHQSTHHVHNILLSISKTVNLKAVILDFLTYSVYQITTKLEIPTYFYFTSGATVLFTFLHFPIVHQKATKPIKDLHMPLEFPGLPKNLSTDDYPDEVSDSQSKECKVLLDSSNTVRECAGIIVNTFDGIEGEVTKALNEGSCFLDGTTPSIFSVGPLITSCYGGDENGCLSWLDSQPSQSVVFLSFGSMGRFSKCQLNEIAIGLEKSEQRFLWIVRSELHLDNLNLDELLPEGFLERTKEKGMVVRNWAPQGAILGHGSIGGFVTHCGWNSVLEAICEGVPMIAWPLYAEQRLNRLILVDEMKIALKVTQLEDKFVTAAELEERIKELMESNNGKEIRERVLKIKTSAKEARGGGGSSLVNLKKLEGLWRDASSNNLSPNSPFNFH